MAQPTESTPSRPQAWIFGGAFDPPHVGHMQVVTDALRESVVARLVVMPVGQHPFDSKSLLSSSEDRWRLCELGFAEYSIDERFFLSRYEIEAEGRSYSYATLQQFSTENPEYAWKWLIGADNVASFDRWRHAEEILSEYGVMVFPRDSVGQVVLMPGMEWVPNATPVKVSSTKIRQAVITGQPITDLVKPEVAAYINDHHLYV